MGVVPPADGFLRGLREICAARGALLIFDEVISGFRAAAGGAQALHGVRPDLTCLGKIIGGGLPVGAYGGRADLMELVVAGRAGLSGRHAVGQPAGDDRRDCGASSHLTPRLYRSLAALGARLAAGLADAARDAGVALQVNAFGSLLTPFFTDRPVRDFAVGDERRHAIATRRSSGACCARGVYPPPSQFEAWFLSAAHTARDVERARSRRRGRRCGRSREP